MSFGDNRVWLTEAGPCLHPSYFYPEALTLQSCFGASRILLRVQRLPKLGRLKALFLLLPPLGVIAPPPLPRLTEWEWQEVGAGVGVARGCQSSVWEQSRSQRNASGMREQRAFVSLPPWKEVHWNSDSTWELFMGDHY